MIIKPAINLEKYIMNEIYLFLLSEQLETVRAASWFIFGGYKQIRKWKRGGWLNRIEYEEN